MEANRSEDQGSNDLEKGPSQRKTTLKWTSNGELSAIDMTRILDRLTNRELTECDLTCNLKNDR